MPPGLREMPALKLLCLKSISRRPEECLTEAKVNAAFFSKAAVNLIKESRALKLGKGGKGISLTKIRQQIITELIENGGRAMSIGFPIPRNFLDNTFGHMKFEASRIDANFMKDRLAPCCPALKSVNLQSCFLLTDEAIKHLLEGCPNLESINVRNCRKLMDETCAHMITFGRRLITIKLGGCFNITANGVRTLIEKHHNRRNFYELGISGLDVNDVTLESIKQSCRNLHSLDIGHSNISEAGAQVLVMALAKSLSVLEVHWCPAITDVFAAWLADNGPQIHKLNFCGVKKVTYQGVTRLLQRRVQLVKADPENFKEITSIDVKYSGFVKGAVESLQQEYPDLNVST